MRRVHTGPLAGLAGHVGLLLALATTVGLTPDGWLAGLLAGATTCVLLGRALGREGRRGLGPADRVTLARAVLAGGVAALVVGSPGRPVAVLVGLASVALVLDAVDGRVARRTGTVTALGARFDMEVDAFLILVLSLLVAGSVGAWVLLIGLARYVFVAASWVVPWLRGSLPPRWWAKVVAAIQGVVLTLVATGLLPAAVATAALAASLALLAESFGHQVVGLWRRRGEAPLPGPDVRRGVSAASTLFAATLVWTVLLAPDRPADWSPAAFLRLPVEGLVLAALLLLVPWRRAVAVIAGLLLAVVAVVELLDLGFLAALDRPFDPLTDPGYARSALGLLGDAIGRGRALAVVALAVAAVLALAVLLPWAVLRLSRVGRRHRAASLRVVAVLAVIWTASATLGLGSVRGTPFATAGAASVTWGHVAQVRAGLRDHAVFARLEGQDPWADTPSSDLLTGLRGKDVLVVFVESYGRVAVQDSPESAQVRAVLDRGTARLDAAGWQSRSAFLTSPTFGGISWLAHATLQSGLWVDSQQRHDQLLSGDRLTLSDAFGRAGWRTVVDVPSNTTDWPQARSFYHYDQVYDSRNVGYAGPRFGYAQVPDQFTLAAFRRLELDRPGRAPVMAEIDLVSSHTPWAPLPRMVPWDEVGDGSVYTGMPSLGQSADAVWSDPARIRAAYGHSIAYSLRALTSFVLTSHDPDLVMVVLGDHQPATVVSGTDAGHDVPVSVIARDPAVMARIDGWDWQPGLRPAPDATVWPMDAFRDRFLTAFGPGSPEPTTVPVRSHP